MYLYNIKTEPFKVFNILEKFDVFKRYIKVEIKPT